MGDGERDLGSAAGSLDLLRESRSDFTFDGLLERDLDLRSAEPDLDLRDLDRDLEPDLDLRLLLPDLERE